MDLAGRESSMACIHIVMPSISLGLCTLQAGSSTQQSHSSSRSLWRESAGEDFGTAPWGHSRIALVATLALPTDHVGSQADSYMTIYYQVLPYITIYYHILPDITIYYQILPDITTYYHYITTIYNPIFDGWLSPLLSIVTQIYWWTNGRSRISWRKS